MQKKLRFKKDNLRYKLTEKELDRMMFRGVISPQHHAILILTSRLRAAGTPAQQRFQMGMNGCGTILLNSINENGGETFGKPYHFLAEITHTTTPSVFKRFLRRYRIHSHPFKK